MNKYGPQLNTILQGLRRRDLHMIHVPVVPLWLEQGVGEPQHQDVLDRLLPQVVVDPVDLALG